MTIEKGLFFHQQGKYKEAIGEYEKLIHHTPHPEVLYNLGLAYSALQSWGKAEEAYRKALEVRAKYHNAQNNLAIVVQNQGRLFEAEAILKDLLLHNPSNNNAKINLGGVLYMQGRPNEAASIIYPVLKNQTHHPQGWFSLGVSLRDMGQLQEAAGCLFRAHQQAPSDPEALLHLGGVLYNLNTPEQTIECFKKAILVAANHHYTKFQLGCLYSLLGQHPQAQDCFEDLPSAKCKNWLSSWQFIKSNMTENTRFFGTTTQTLQFAVNQAIPSGDVIELGVRFGTTLHYLQQICNSDVHGFDSFVGLPTHWNELPKGSYSTNGTVPRMGSQVHLYEGWFTDTLPTFVAEHDEQIRILHVDCDLYSSTKQALCILSNKIKRGSILVFDEFLMNPNWQDDEHLAFIEAADENDWKYEYIAFGLMSNQAAVRIY